MSSSLVVPRRAPKKQGLEGLLQSLSEIQIGGTTLKIRRKDLVYIFRNLSTLLVNGLSLAKALETLRDEKELKRYRPLIESLERHVTNGAMLSTAMNEWPDSFSELMINQIRIGERSGSLSETISRIAEQLENGANIRSAIVKKLTYPCLLATAGAGALTFMLLYVVPTFENMYAESGAELPGITQFLITVGQVLTTYGWAVALGLVAFVATVIAIWRQPAGRLAMERVAFRIPVLDSWLRSIALLQFTDVLGNLMESGFNLADALPHTSKAITSRVIRSSVEQLQAAVLRGERFSRELEKRRDIFPPVVTQLVLIGERTGTLPNATKHIREHLRREVERYTGILTGSIEPVMTIGLAVSIGGILLAVYLPMFDMIGAMN
ncbi:MAG: type II secretion system F family protein [Planctomycetota bacterium]|jgi:type IV pilus assembly protein PilC